MPDYQLSKIYKLWSPSTNLIYIGSTTQTIAQRLAEHLAVYRRYKNNKGYFITSFKILECEDYKIELIENYSCNNKEQLHKKEGEYIRSLDCVNKKIEGRTKKEYEKDYKEKNKEKRDKYLIEYTKKNKEKIKTYYENNREKKLEYMKEYYEKNKEKKLEYNKVYQKIYSKEHYEKNKEKIKEYQKEYREKKKLEQKK